MDPERILDELEQWLAFMAFETSVAMDKEANRPSAPQGHVTLMAAKEAYENSLRKLRELRDS